ncbi:hypothetical protein ZIOFF_034506 [Zingiber officinale]|uniref:Myosin XI n=1 Tax=Zingiber officinale TaxID=94328 RepID=A0A8J5GSE1_ZINOF|nr:hypothetical protein ZIOFF_034506 [Zingiber officinale]
MKTFILWQNLAGDDCHLSSSSGKVAFTYMHSAQIAGTESSFTSSGLHAYTGSILIAVNPFRRLPHLYDIHMMEQYKGANFGELNPHPFAVADAAYRQMIKEGIRQSILVSGESGAGKTESTKMLMRYLAYIGGRSESDGRSIEQLVLQSNPLSVVLEAFGNAKTIRNNNSSRFGKFVELQFDQNGRISGAAVRTYLLERSRVCQISDPERNYHCFYMLCDAPPEVMILELSLVFVDDAKEYLETKKAMDIIGISGDEQDAIFRVVAAILHQGNIEFAEGRETDSSQPKDERSWFHLKTASELLMCDIKGLEDSLCKRVIVTRGFDVKRGTVHDVCVFGGGGFFELGGFAATEHSGFEPLPPPDLCFLLRRHWEPRFPLSIASTTKELRFDVKRGTAYDVGGFFELGVSAATEHNGFEPLPPPSSCFLLCRHWDQGFLRPSLTPPRSSAGNDLFETNSSPAPLSCRRRLAAGSRCRLLPRPQSRPVVAIASSRSHSCRRRLLPQPQSRSAAAIASSLVHSRCRQPPLPPPAATVAAGSRRHLLSQPQLASPMDAVTLCRLHTICLLQPLSRDGVPTIESLCGGIIALLDEACMLPRSTHETFAQKLYQSFKNNKCFSKPKLSRSDFTICHYAGDVTYQTELSLEKNKDYVVVEHQALLAASKCFFISSLFLPSSEDASKPSKFSSIGSKFKILKMFLPQIFVGYVPHASASGDVDKRIKKEHLFICADIEETKTQENEKLQVALQEMQQKFDEMKALLAKEREVANVAVKEVSFIKEVPVSDTALLDKLRDENEKLKALVSSLKAKIAETEKKYEESIITSEQRLKKAMEAESEIVDLKNAMDRLQEKLSSLESEAQILRQRAVFSSPIKSMQEHLSTPITPTKQYLETDQHDFEEMKVANVSQSAGQALRDIANSDAKLRRSSMERNQENLDALIKCVSKNIGFSQEKPVAASTIYKCLLHWKSFEVEKTSVFDRLIEMFGSVIEEEENNNHLAYWLSNGSHLLYLLQHNLKVTSAVGGTPNRKPTAPTSFFGRMTRSFRSSSHALDELSAVQQVEAKYPALLFKLQLTAYVEKIYGIIRDNVKKDLLRLLSLCIQAPRAASVSLRSTSGLQVQSNNWQAIIERFDNLLNTLQENYYIGSSWDELKHVRQAVDFLVLFQKSRVSFDDIVNDLCPVLSSYQLYRIGTHYWDDKYNTKSVSADVLSRLRRLMSEVTSEVKSSSFLLDDNSSIPFSVDEISNSLRLEEFLEVRPAADLLDDPAFYFLLQ